MAKSEDAYVTETLAPPVLLSENKDITTVLTSQEFCESQLY